MPAPWPSATLAFSIASKDRSSGSTIRKYGQRPKRGSTLASKWGSVAVIAILMKVLPFAQLASPRQARTRAMFASVVASPFREVKLTSFCGLIQGRCRRSSRNGRSTSGLIRSGTSCTSYRCRTSTDHCGRGLQPLPAAGGETIYPEVPCLSSSTVAPYQA